MTKNLGKTYDRSVLSWDYDDKYIRTSSLNRPLGANNNKKWIILVVRGHWTIIGRKVWAIIVPKFGTTTSQYLLPVTRFTVF